MSDGPKPPLPRPGLVQKPGGDGRSKAPPPPPQALKAGLPKPQDISALPSFFKKSSLPPVSPIPPAPKIPVPANIPASESSGSRRLPTPAGGAQSTSESSGDRRIPIPTPEPGSVKPKKPDRADITALIRRTGENPIATPIGSKPPFNGEAPLAEPPAEKAEPPAAVSTAPAPKPERTSYFPVEIEVDIGELDTPLPAPLATPAPTPISFGAIDANAKTALGIMFNLFSYGNEKPLELRGGKLFMEGKECGDIHSAKSSGETLRISLEKLGIANAQLGKNSALLSKLGSIFNTLNENFLVHACEKNDYAAITANSSGVRLSFYKAGLDSPSNSFPLRLGGMGEEKR